MSFTLAIFILLSILGFLTLNLIKGTTFLEKLSLSFPVGIGVYTFLMFLGNWIGIPFNPFHQSIMIAFSTWGLLVFNLVMNKPQPPFPKAKMSLSPACIFLLVIATFVSASFLYTTYWPVHSFDSLTMYDFRGLVFQKQGKIFDIDDAYHGSYPLLTSLAHTLFYLFGSKNPQWLYSAFYLSLLAFFFERARRLVGNTKSAILTALFATTPIIFYFSTIAYTNLPYTLYIFASFVFVIDLIKGNEEGRIVLIGLMLGLASWIRPATEWFFISVLFAVFLLARKVEQTPHFNKRSLMNIMTLLAVFSFFYAPWRIYQKLVLNLADPTNGIVPFLTSGIRFDMVREIIKTTIDFLAVNQEKEFGLVMLVFALSFPFIRKKNIPTFCLLILYFFSWVSAIYSARTIYETDAQWLHASVQDSAKRLFIIFVPVFLYVSAEFFSNIKSNSATKNENIDNNSRL